MEVEDSGDKVNKIEILLRINRAIINDDMEAMFQAISTYMFYRELTVSSETIMRFSEDGLISQSDNTLIEQWPYESDDKKKK